MEKRNESGQVPDAFPPSTGACASERLQELLRGSNGASLRLTEDHILSVLFVRRARSSILGEKLFSDPAWDILLELYAAKLGQRTMSAEDLARAIGTPESTTRRWIAVIEDCGLARWDDDQPEPGRLVSLSACGASKMERLADQWGSAFTSI